MNKTNHRIVISFLMIIVASSFYFIGYKIAYDRMAHSYTDVGGDTFYGRITDIDDIYFSVEGLPVNDMNFRGNFNVKISGEEIEFQWRYATIELSEFDIGDTISITFIGGIQESDPAYIEQVVKIKLLDDEK